MNNRDVLTVNGGNGRIVETDPDNGRPVSRFLDRSGKPTASAACQPTPPQPHKSQM